MGKKKEHQIELLEVAKSVISLGETIKEMEKHMNSIWSDEIEKKDLEHLKEGMKKVENSLCNLKGEILHLEEMHCKRT